MIEKIYAIEHALECKCYLPALALALTLPDICGQIEYPDLKKKSGQRLIWKQYITWFNDWVGHWYAGPDGWIEDGKKAKNPYFTGKMCYDLRCAFLHSGNADVDDFGDLEDEENRYSYNFELCTNGGDSFGTVWETPQYGGNKTFKVKNVRIDMEILCERLCNSAKKYYDSKGNKAFIDHKITIVDLKKEVEKLQN